MNPALPSDTPCPQAKSLVNWPLDQENIIEVLDHLDNTESYLQTKALWLMEILEADSSSLPRDMLESRPLPQYLYLNIYIGFIGMICTEVIRLNQGIFQGNPNSVWLKRGKFIYTHRPGVAIWRWR